MKNLELHDPLIELLDVGPGLKAPLVLFGDLLLQSTDKSSCPAGAQLAEEEERR